MVAFLNPHNPSSPQPEVICLIQPPFPGVCLLSDVALITDHISAVENIIDLAAPSVG
jgi:hypothetical protein